MMKDVYRSAGLGKRLVNFLIVLLVLTLGIGIGTLISYRVGAIGPGDSQLKIQSDSKPLAGPSALALSQAFEEVANRVEPAVVNINTEEVIKVTQRRRGGQSQPPREDPFDWFHQFFNGPEEFTRRSLGSGVLVDPKGYIITNSHVVEGASKIKVNLQGGQEYTARIIAADSLSDIAVIKIDGRKEFPYARIGDARRMKVGEWVLAIGSPFGLEQTVTAGIISATGRVFPDPGSANSIAMLFNDYLQTDAAINPGNSGGPLVNMNGEVVGINTFISTTTRANAGVGFAVPSHILVNAYNQIIEKGRVTRGYLGVNMNQLALTPAMAKYFGVKQGSGVLVTGLSDETGKNQDSGPAAAAGMKPEDVVVEFDGKKISDVQDLRLAVANTQPGSKVKVKVVRFGEEKALDVTIGERKLEAREGERENFSFEEKEETPKPEIGLRFNDVPPRVARDLNITGGALVEEVKPGSLAEDAGLIGQSQGVLDVIVAANGKKVESAQDLFNFIKGLRSGETAVLKFLRVSQGPPLTYYTSITKP